VSVRPRIAFLLGDPNGIGPEIGAKVLARAENARRADIVVYGDESILEEGERVSGVRMPRGADSPRLEALGILEGASLTPGEATMVGGRAALGALTAAAQAARAGRIDGIVFAPLNKHALRLAGLDHEDELRYLQAFFGVEDFVSEFNITGDLWTSRVTSHIPLKDVPGALSVDGTALDVGQLLAQNDDALLEARELLPPSRHLARREVELDGKAAMRQLGVALGAFALARERAHLRLHLADEIIQPLQIDRRFLEPTLGGPAAVTIQSDARGFLEELAPLVGPIGE